MNISATLNIFRLIRDPALCLPHASVLTFNHLPIPISKAFVSQEKGQVPDIRAVVLDKDNCFARPKENVVYKPYIVRLLIGHKVRCNAASLHMSISLQLVYLLGFQSLNF